MTEHHWVLWSSLRVAMERLAARVSGGDRELAEYLADCARDRFASVVDGWDPAVGNTVEAWVMYKTRLLMVKRCAPWRRRRAKLASQVRELPDVASPSDGGAGQEVRSMLEAVGPASAEVLRLRMAGATFEEIAALFGVGRNTARDWYLLAAEEARRAWGSGEG